MGLLQCVSLPNTLFNQSSLEHIPRVHLYSICSLLHRDRPIIRVLQIMVFIQPKMLCSNSCILTNYSPKFCPLCLNLSHRIFHIILTKLVDNMRQTNNSLRVILEHYQCFDTVLHTAGLSTCVSLKLFDTSENSRSAATEDG